MAPTSRRVSGADLASILRQRYRHQEVNLMRETTHYQMDPAEPPHRNPLDGRPRSYYGAVQSSPDGSGLGPQRQPPRHPQHQPKGRVVGGFPIPDAPYPVSSKPHHMHTQASNTLGHAHSAPTLAHPSSVHLQTLGSSNPLARRGGTRTTFLVCTQLRPPPGPQSSDDDEGDRASSCGSSNRGMRGPSKKDHHRSVHNDVSGPQEGDTGTLQRTVHVSIPPVPVARDWSESEDFGMGDTHSHVDASSVDQGVDGGRHNRAAESTRRMALGTKTTASTGTGQGPLFKQYDGNATHGERHSTASSQHRKMRQRASRGMVNPKRLFKRRGKRSVCYDSTGGHGNAVSTGATARDSTQRHSAEPHTYMRVRGSDRPSGQVRTSHVANEREAPGSNTTTGKSYRRRNHRKESDESDRDRDGWARAVAAPLMEEQTIRRAGRDPEGRWAGQRRERHQQSASSAMQLSEVPASPPISYSEKLSQRQQQTQHGGALPSQPSIGAKEARSALAQPGPPRVRSRQRLPSDSSDANQEQLRMTTQHIKPTQAASAEESRTNTNSPPPSSHTESAPVDDNAPHQQSSVSKSTPRSNGGQPGPPDLESAKTPKCLRPSVSAPVLSVSQHQRSSSRRPDPFERFKVSDLAPFMGPSEARGGFKKAISMLKHTPALAAVALSCTNGWLPLHLLIMLYRTTPSQQGERHQHGRGKHGTRQCGSSSGVNGRNVQRGTDRGSTQRCQDGTEDMHRALGLLRQLVLSYPEATRIRFAPSAASKGDDMQLPLFVALKRRWCSEAIKVLVFSYPEAAETMDCAGAGPGSPTGGRSGPRRWARKLALEAGYGPDVLGLLPQPRKAREGGLQWRRVISKARPASPSS